jgi:uncharacterized membrane protein
MSAPPPLLDPADRTRIDAAVAAAARQSAVPLAAVVRESSGPYERAEDLTGLFVGSAVAVATWLLLPAAQTVGDSWAGYPGGVKLLLAAGAFLAAAVGGTAAASRSPALRRLFTSRRQMRRRVDQASQLAFATLPTRPSASSDAPGLLIYVSLYERRAALLADATTLEQLGQSTLNQLCRDLTHRLSRQPIAEAVETIIRDAADRLPAATNSRDQQQLPPGSQQSLASVVAA